ncbi:MAG: F0F1 ATP synthase subunit epsilon [Streptosporangiales bacterium]|nr:F0F1 ATP synthase subunit epsilon [Streptosporangiales bacterium]
MAKLRVELVAPERQVWSGEADMVLARTLEGELGILPNHAPLFGALVEGGVVRVHESAGSEEVVAAVSGGFLSVTENRVSILAEYAELGQEVDVEEAHRALERALADADHDEEAQAEVERQRARLRASGQEV